MLPWFSSFPYLSKTQTIPRRWRVVGFELWLLSTSPICMLLTGSLCFCSFLCFGVHTTYSNSKNSPKHRFSPPFFFSFFFFSLSLLIYFLISVPLFLFLVAFLINQDSAQQTFLLLLYSNFARLFGTWDKTSIFLLLLLLHSCSYIDSTKKEPPAIAKNEISWKRPLDKGQSETRKSKE